jgi:hypothetical protein
MIELHKRKHNISYFTKLPIIHPLKLRVGHPREAWNVEKQKQRKQVAL